MFLYPLSRSREMIHPYGGIRGNAPAAGGIAGLLTHSNPTADHAHQGRHGKEQAGQLEGEELNFH